MEKLNSKIWNSPPERPVGYNNKFSNRFESNQQIFPKSLTSGGVHHLLNKLDTIFE